MLYLSQECSSFIVSVINDDDGPSRSMNSSGGSPQYLIEEMKKSMRDCQIQGTVIFRCMPWISKINIATQQLKVQKVLLYRVLRPRGQLFAER